MRTYKSIPHDGGILRMTNNAIESKFESKLINLDTHISDIKKFIIHSVQSGATAHDVERELYRKVFELGLSSLKSFFVLHGDGDVGKTLVMPDGNEVKRLDGLRPRNYRSVFGSIILNRAVYGTRQKSKIECVPLDARLQLPEGEQSHVFQEISQFICMEMSYKKGKEALERFLPITTTVDTLENVTREQSDSVKAYREIKPAPEPDEEGEILVITADGKGIPIKQPLPSKEVKIEEHRFKKGPKPGRKRMAVVGGIYSIDPYIRTPEEIVEALFKESGANDKRTKPTKLRPVPEHKEIIANLDKETGGVTKLATDETFEYLLEKSIERFDTDEQEIVFIFDGQPSLWNKKKEYFGSRTGIEILDLLHVNSYLWDVATLMYPGKKGQQVEFMKDRLVKILEGDIGRVIGGFKQSATKLKFSKTKKEKLEKICNYLENNKKRMRYDLFLKRGFPIATGIIEGACRHYIKDRMERAGMRWSMDGAQAMLDMRSIFINGDWSDFQKFRIEKETEMAYPYKDMFNDIEWPIAA